MNKKGLLGLSPLIVFVGLYIALAFAMGGFANIPISFVFFITSIYAVATCQNTEFQERVKVFGRGAGTTKVMFIISILLVAGVFCGSAEAMGSVSETVKVMMSLLPAKFLYLSIFVAACMVSMATGSGIGSIVAVAPIAIEAANISGQSLPVICSAVVCGAMFGDNMSFVSDTTIIATASQGCQMKDKFFANLKIATPAFVLTAVIYLVLGRNASPIAMNYDSIQYVKILPYLIVLVMSICGANVLVLLLIGTLSCVVLGMVLGSFSFVGWVSAAASGMEGMSTLVLIILLASGMLAVISHNGGMDYLVGLCLRFVHGRRSAELCIAVLSGLFCICTGNNTVAIISVAPVAKDLSDKFGVDPKRSASLLDTASAVVLELIPYSAHLLAIAGLAKINVVSMIPYMYYAYLLGIMTLLSIVFSGKRA